MACIDCHTQADLDAALARGDCPHLVGDGSFVVRGSASVEAWDSASVEAWGSASVRAGGSASVRAGDSASVEAGGSASVEAWGSASVRASGSASVRAGKFVPVQDHGPDVSVTGGVLISIRAATTAKEWCEFNDVPITGKGAGRQVVLFKIVRDDFRSSRGGDYTPGTIPIAQDWDGGKAECGGGLHFSPRPWLAREFDSEGTRYVACPVKLSHLRAPAKTDSMPQKIKGKGACGPCWECDEDGEPIGKQP